MKSEHYVIVPLLVAFVGLMLLLWPWLAWSQLLGAALMYWSLVLLIAFRD